MLAPLRTVCVQAPVPFLVGMQYKTEEVQALTGGLVRVNVSKDTVRVLPLTLLRQPPFSAHACAPELCSRERLFVPEHMSCRLLHGTR